MLKNEKQKNKSKFFWNKSIVLKRLVDIKFYKKLILKQKLYMYIYNRSWLISKHNLRYKYTIHKGKQFSKLKMNKWLTKTKFGTYAFTRKPFVFIKKKKKKKR